MSLAVLTIPKTGLVMTGRLLLAAVETSSQMAMSHISRPSYQWRPDVQAVIVESDIVAKIETVQALLITIQKKRLASAASASSAESTHVEDNVSNQEGVHSNASSTGEETNSSSSSSSTDVIEVCLRNLHLILEEITATMKEVTTELDLHETRYFASYRTPNIQQLLQKLKSQSGILEKRLDMLIKCMSVSE